MPSGRNVSDIDEQGVSVAERGTEQQAPPRLRRSRRRLQGLGIGALVLLVLGGLVVTLHGGGRQSSPTSVVTGTDPHPSGGGAWLSGASGPGAANGAIGAWRGRPLEIAGTWADNNEAMVQLWQVQRGGEYGSWDKPIDIAIGAIGPGETWAQAAQGTYDDRWRQSLTNLRRTWGARPGTVYIRFAHESNGNWYPWAVNAANHQDFLQAWKRFRGLQKEIFPAAKLVFCVNRESVGNDMDWRKTFPGTQDVDVLGVDYYNQNPYAGTDEDWERALLETDSYGAPVGLEAHRTFAQSVGLPLAVPEWSGVADAGDSPAFIKGMFRFFQARGGTGPGQLAYEVLFNNDMANTNFPLYGKTRMPRSAHAYQETW